MILLADIFHISNGTSFLVGVKRTNCNFDFPCYFDLYVQGLILKRIRAEGLVLDNNLPIDEYFEKELISRANDAYLKAC